MAKRVLVVGGSEEFVGAVYLAGIGALRGGAESVIIMAPEKVAWALNTLSPDLMTRKLKGKYLTRAHESTIKHQLKTADILLLGNGAGIRPETAALMRTLMRLPIPKIVDADALKALRRNYVRNAILTPNEGEWKLLRVHNSIDLILKNANVIIKKGPEAEILSNRKKTRLRKTNPGLTKAGMGDVLAGLCAGHLAQGLSLWDSAQKACKMGNRIANILTKRKKGYYFLASDLVKELQKAKQHAYT